MAKACCQPALTCGHKQNEFIASIYVCIAAIRIHILRDFCVTASFLQVAASFKVQPRPLLLLPTPAALLPLLQLLLQATPLPRQPPLLPGAPSTAALLQPLQLRATVPQLLPLLLPAALASALAPPPRPLPHPAAALTAGLPLLPLLPVTVLQQLLHLLPAALDSMVALLHHRRLRLAVVLLLAPLLQVSVLACSRPYLRSYKTTGRLISGAASFSKPVSHSMHI